MSSSGEISFAQHNVIEFQTSTHLQWPLCILLAVASPTTEKIFVFVLLVLVFISFLFLFDHCNSSSSFLKTTTNNSSSRFHFRDENYTDYDFSCIDLKHRHVDVLEPTTIDHLICDALCTGRTELSVTLKLSTSLNRSSWLAVLEAVHWWSCAFRSQR